MANRFWARSQETPEAGAAAVAEAAEAARAEPNFGELMDERLWQWLAAAELSPARARQILGTVVRERRASRDEIASHPLLSRAEADRVRDASDSAIEGALRAGVRLLAEADYPEGLRSSGEAPPAVFVWGDPACLQAPAVGIVGTRGATAYGKAVASKFAEALARAGATVISGGALGIDSAAHRGALAVGGRTAAVLAGGVDRVYPAVHAGLFMQIREHGCLVSQFALGSSPSGYRFLVRNRLIAGLCRAVVVVEAPERSGALSTAHAANDFGREVFVVPATIDKMGFRGSHALIRDGATLVDHPDQVLEAVGLPTSAALAAPERSPASSVGEAILAALTENPITTDRLAEQTGLGAAQLLAELTDLEMEGWVTKHPGGFAKRV